MSSPLFSHLARRATDDRPTTLRSRGLVDSAVHVDPFRFSHGLTGVDQEGNFLWVHVMLACFIALCFFTLSLRIIYIVNGWLRKVFGASAPQRQQYWAENSTNFWPWLKRHVFYAPLWNKRHNREIQLSSAISMGTLPSRFHMILIVVYTLSNVAYCLALPWGRSEKASVVAALRGRSGTLSALNLVPTILFALRNNPLIPLLRVSYDTFNLFHRWAARITIAEALIHTLCWFFNTYNTGGFAGVDKLLKDELSYRTGMVGTVGFLFLGIQAWSPLRHAAYETFLNFHRIAYIIAIVCVYVHIDTHSLPQLPWMYLIFALYAFEMAYRLFTILYYNAGRSLTRVTVEAMPAEACRVTLELRRAWHVSPGSNAHIYLPGVALWSSHPFSIAWTHPTTMENPKHLDVLPTSEKDIHVPLYAPKTNKVSFVVRARTGMTRKIYNRARNSASGSFTTYGMMEGPYGGHENLGSYGTVVLFAAGVGITHQISHVHDLVRGYSASTVATRRVVLVWVVQELDCLSWIKEWMDEIFAMKGRKEVLRVMLFVTRPKDRFALKSPSNTVTMHPGRPNVEQILDREIADRKGAVAVTVCGPGAFSDGVRSAARERVEHGVVDFIEEAFSY